MTEPEKTRIMEQSNKEVRCMDSNMTFRTNSDVNQQVNEIGAHETEEISRAQMLADTEDILEKYASDYQRMAK